MSAVDVASEETSTSKMGTENEGSKTEEAEVSIEASAQEKMEQHGIKPTDELVIEIIAESDMINMKNDDEKQYTSQSQSPVKVRVCFVLCNLFSTSTVWAHLCLYIVGSYVSLSVRLSICYWTKID